MDIGPTPSEFLQRYATADMLSDDKIDEYEFWNLIRNPNMVDSKSKFSSANTQYISHKNTPEHFIEFKSSELEKTTRKDTTTGYKFPTVYGTNNYIVPLCDLNGDGGIDMSSNSLELAKLNELCTVHEFTSDKTQTKQYISDKQKSHKIADQEFNNTLIGVANFVLDHKSQYITGKIIDIRENTKTTIDDFEKDMFKKNRVKFDVSLAQIGKLVEDGVITPISPLTKDDVIRVATSLAKERQSRKEEPKLTALTEYQFLYTFMRMCTFNGTIDGTLTPQKKD